MGVHYSDLPCVLHAQWSMAHMEVVTRDTRSSVEGERKERQGSTVPQGYLSAQSTETSTRNGHSWHQTRWGLWCITYMPPTIVIGARNKVKPEWE